MVERLRDRIALADLRAEYCHRFDSFDAEGWPALFVNDGQLTVGNSGPEESRGTHRGRKELRALLEDLAERRQFMRHMVHTPIVSVSGGTATGRWYFETVMALADGSYRWVVGDYHDQYCRRDDSWLFESVDVTVNWCVSHDADGSYDIDKPE